MAVGVFCFYGVMHVMFFTTRLLTASLPMCGHIRILRTMRILLKVFNRLENWIKERYI